MSRMTPEGYEKRDLKRWLDTLDCYHFWPVQTGYGSTTVDCLACINGLFWAIEVKAPGEKPTPRQFAILEQCKRAGAMTTWGTFEQIKGTLEAHFA